MKSQTYESRMAEKAALLRERGHARILAVESSCDETAIAIVEDGRIEAVGRHEELYASSAAYRKMVDLQRLEEEGGME